MKRIGITIVTAFFFFNSLAQSPTKKTISDRLSNTWYESPHESKDGNIVYLRNKYVPVPGIDKQEDPLRMLIINNDGSFIKTQYCGYCPDLKLEEKKGTYEILQQDNVIRSLKISFSNENNNESLKIISCTEDKLVLNLQQATNTK